MGNSTAVERFGTSPGQSEFNDVQVEGQDRITNAPRLCPIWWQLEDGPRQQARNGCRCACQPSGPSGRRRGRSSDGGPGAVDQVFKMRIRLWDEIAVFREIQVLKLISCSPRPYTRANVFKLKGNSLSSSSCARRWLASSGMQTSPGAEQTRQPPAGGLQAAPRPPRGKRASEEMPPTLQNSATEGLKEPAPPASKRS